MKQESTASKRVWKKGPPPHIGWWNASMNKLKRVWRWWDGRCWSRPSSPGCSAKTANSIAAMKVPSGHLVIEWNDYYPEGARVPRIKP